MDQVRGRDTIAKRTLSAAHRRKLEGSGLTPGTIAASGIYTETDPAAVARLLNWRRPADDAVPALVIPFRGLDGKPAGHARLKPRKPRPEGGKLRHGPPRKFAPSRR